MDRVVGLVASGGQEGETGTTHTVELWMVVGVVGDGRTRHTGRAEERLERRRRI
jgi:hypothetical protein